MYLIAALKIQAHEKSICGNEFILIFKWFHMYSYSSVKTYTSSNTADQTLKSWKNVVTVDLSKKKIMTVSVMIFTVLTLLKCMFMQWPKELYKKLRSKY